MVIVLYALTALLYGALAWYAWARRGGLEAQAAGALVSGGQDALTKPLNASPADDGASQGEPSEM
ncbi:inner membrane protein YpjD, partial [Ralstonia pseudosolanacearum]